MPARISMANMAMAIMLTSPMVRRGISPTEDAALDRMSMGLKTFTIILDIWVLVWASSMPFFVMKYPAPIMMSRHSIWKNTVIIAMGDLLR